MAAVGQLASSVAHQINNPLTVIIANSQIMGMDMDPDLPDAAIIKHIEEAGTHIRKIVQNLLDFSTQDSYEWFETNVHETIEDALTLVSHSLRKSDITVQKKIEPLPTIIASASHLKLLWMNLLLNAREAIDAGSQSGVVEIAATQTAGNAVQITITDNGVGIPLQHRDRLFHPFFTTKTSGKNLGLGLFTCGTVVEFHQGKIELNDAAVPPGTVVAVTLPVNPDTIA
jgi:two-component system NtrC family sensor kinase